MNTEYLIGLPSGQIIDIVYTEINNIKQDGLISYNQKLESYIFKDDDFDKILSCLKRDVNIFNKHYMNMMMEFFDKQKRVDTYILLSGGVVDVKGSIYISGGKWPEMPFKFKSVSGDFVFRNCELTTLMGSPDVVGGFFDVSGNDLMSLKGGPKKVGISYDCSNNFLKDLYGSPEFISTSFDCSDNQLKNLMGGPERVKSYFDCTKNPLIYMDGKPDCPNIIGGIGLKKKNIKYRDEGEGKMSW